MIKELFHTCIIILYISGEVLIGYISHVMLMTKFQMNPQFMRRDHAMITGWKVVYSKIMKLGEKITEYSGKTLPLCTEGIFL